MAEQRIIEHVYKELVHKLDDLVQGTEANIAAMDALKQQYASLFVKDGSNPAPSSDIKKSDEQQVTLNTHTP